MTKNITPMRRDPLALALMQVATGTAHGSAEQDLEICRGIARCALEAAGYDLNAPPAEKKEMSKP